MMIYGILRIFRSPAASGIYAMAAMTVIELFQLTMIPAHLLKSNSLLIRLCARLMGVEFSFLDLLTYAIGIGCISWLDSLGSTNPRDAGESVLR